MSTYKKFLSVNVFLLGLSILFNVPVSFAQEAVQTKDGVDYQEGSCSNLGIYLTDCEKFKCAMPHPKIPHSVIRQEIFGLNEKGQCVHEQIMSADEKIICNYSEDARKYIAMRMEQKKSNVVGNIEREQLERILLEDIFANECNFIKGGSEEPKKETSEQ